jgi:hypothetical protein
MGEKFNHDHDYNALVFLEEPFVLEMSDSDMKRDIPEQEKKELVSLI